MLPSLNSKEGQRILNSLSSSTNASNERISEVGRGFIGALGFRLVGIARQFFQAPDAYQNWLNEQRSRVVSQFLAMCKSETGSQHKSEQLSTFEGQKAKSESPIDPSNLEKLRTQKILGERPRVLRPSEFNKLLIPTQLKTKDRASHGLQRLLELINPFDQADDPDQDWLGRLRFSGIGLKVEIEEALESYYDLLESDWNPKDKHSWVAIGAHLMQLNVDISRLCRSAEELVLAGHATEAGFNLSLIFTLLKGLASEHSMLAYLISHPEKIAGVRDWDEALSKARGF